MDNIIIRDAAEEDAKYLAVLAHEFAKYEVEAALSSESSIIADAFGDNPACKFIVAENNTSSEVVGFAMFYAGYDLLSATRGSHLGDVFVLEEYRGNGIGKLLIKGVSSQVVEQEGEWLSWTVDRSNKSARAFYASLKAHNIDVCFMALGRAEMQGLIK